MRVWLGYGFAIAVIVFSVRYVGVNLSTFKATISDITFPGLLASIILFVLHTLANAFSFVLLGRAFKIRLPASFLACSWLGTILAKYVPGSIWQIVGRGVLLNTRGVPLKTSFVLGAVEQGISVAICGLVSAVMVWVVLAPSWWGACLLAGGSIALVFASPYGLRLIGYSIDASSFRRALGGYTIAMIPYTLGYMMIVAPVAPLKFVAALFFGTIAGVLALFVPGGIGIRESTTTLVMSTPDAGQLLAGMLSVRVLIFFVEVLLSLTGLYIMRCRSRL